MVNNRGQLVAYLLVLVAALSANWLTIYNSNKADAARLAQARDGCERTNDLRAQLNAQNQEFLDHMQVTYKLFMRVGKSAPEGSQIRADLLAAGETQQRLANTYHPLAIIDCNKAYPKT